WETSGTTALPFSRDNGVISTIAISPDGKSLAIIGVNAKKLQVCSLLASPPECSVLSGLEGWGYSVVFSEDGHRIGASSGIEAEKGLVLVSEITKNNPRLLEGHADRVSSIQFDRSGERAVSASWDGTVRIWDASSAKELVRLMEPRGRTSTAG